jgi:predicted 3-demethylubiquinone-9 3-methyltransferase (glyoxalase superfamily)
MMVAFNLDGREFVALDGGPQVGFSPTISFVVNCDTQAEVEESWERLTARGELHVCGWLKDRHGVWRQILPRVLTRMLANADAGRTAVVMQARVKLKSLEIAEPEQAFNGR